MTHLNLFFNHKIVNPESQSLLDKPVAFGNWCFTPIRCLLNGNKVTVSTGEGSVKINVEKEYGGDNKPKRNLLRVVASIALLVPGIIIGTPFKALGYLSASVRDSHYQTLKHLQKNTPSSFGKQANVFYMDKDGLAHYKPRPASYQKPVDNVFYMDKHGFAHAKPSSSKKSDVNVIYMDDNGVAHLDPENA